MFSLLGCKCVNVVVTIGYLKDFIGDIVQNSTNGNPISIQRSDDTYCPTYSELTGGTIIQTWSGGTTPKSDRDGITVSPTWAGGNSGYSANQLVDQRDLGLKYTRFRTLSISRSDSGDISECGGNATLAYTYNHTRYTKSMNSSCDVSTTSSSVSSPCNQLTYHTTYGSVSNCTNYSIGKNGSFSANPRTDAVYATTTFRGSTKASNNVYIKQNALTGSYSKEKSRWEVTTNVTASATSVTSFDCPKGEYSARGTRIYNVVGRFAWVDSCNVEYSQTQDRNIVTNQRQDLGSKTGSFSNHDCCDGGYNETKTLTFSSGSYSASVNFSQNCSDCSSTPQCTGTCEGIEYSIYPDKQIGCGGGNVTFTLEGGCSCSSLNVPTTSITFDDTGSTESITYTLVSGCELSWSKPSWVTITDNGSSLSCTASAYSSGERSGTITLKVNNTDCKSISVYQGSEPPVPVECPASGGGTDWQGVLFIGDHEIDGDANDEVGMLAFKTGDTSFASIKSLTCDGTVVTAATWTTEGGEVPTGWKRITVSHGANPSTSSTRSGSVTVKMTKTDGGECTYVANLTQKPGSQPTPPCTVTFNISGSYNHIDMVSLQGTTVAGTYLLNGSGNSRTAEIPCGITFTGIVFNDTNVGHCAYLTNSTGGTITDGATFNGTITGTTCH